MWHNKRKVTYIFEDEKLNNNEQNDETNQEGNRLIVMKPEVEVEKGPVIEETQENKNDKNIGKAKLQAYAGGKL